MTNHNYSVQMLTQGLRVPALLMEDGRIVVAVPEAFETASLIVGGKLIESTSPAPGQRGIVQYLDSPYLESYLYVSPEPGVELWVGPFLRKQVREREVTQMIREKAAPLGCREKLLRYFSQRQVLDDRQYYYMGKLIQGLFEDSGPPPAPAGEPAAKPARIWFYGPADGSMGERPEQPEHSPYFFEREMVQLVTCGDLSGALDTMKRINTYPRAVLARDAVRSLKNSLICNCTILARAAITGGGPFGDAFSVSDRLILTVERAESILQLEELERGILMEFVSLVDSCRSARFSKPVRDVISYIKQNLSEKLTLRELSDHVSLHPNYLSALFRKETGENLSRYIMNQRIEEAKFYLRHTGDPISAISNFYQFSSQSHFIQRFSQNTGMTPLQYRKTSKD